MGGHEAAAEKKCESNGGGGKGSRHQEGRGPGKGHGKGGKGKKGKGAKGTGMDPDALALWHCFQQFAQGQYGGSFKGNKGGSAGKGQHSPARKLWLCNLCEHGTNPWAEEECQKCGQDWRYKGDRRDSRGQKGKGAGGKGKGPRQKGHGEMGADRGKGQAGQAAATPPPWREEEAGWHRVGPGGKVIRQGARERSATPGGGKTHEGGHRDPPMQSKRQEVAEGQAAPATPKAAVFQAPGGEGAGQASNGDAGDEDRKRMADQAMAAIICLQATWKFKDGEEGMAKMLDTMRKEAEKCQETPHDGQVPGAGGAEGQDKAGGGQGKRKEPELLLRKLRDKQKKRARAKQRLQDELEEAQAATLALETRMEELDKKIADFAERDEELEDEARGILEEMVEASGGRIIGQEEDSGADYDTGDDNGGYGEADAEMDEDAEGGKGGAQSSWRKRRQSRKEREVDAEEQIPYWRNVPAQRQAPQICQDLLAKVRPDASKEAKELHAAVLAWMATAGKQGAQFASEATKAEQVKQDVLGKQVQEAIRERASLDRAALVQHAKARMQEAMQEAKDIGDENVVKKMAGMLQLVQDDDTMDRLAKRRRNEGESDDPSTCPTQ